MEKKQDLSLRNLRKEDADLPMVWSPDHRYGVYFGELLNSRFQGPTLQVQNQNPGEGDPNTCL